MGHFPLVMFDEVKIPQNPKKNNKKQDPFQKNKNTSSHMFPFSQGSMQKLRRLVIPLKHPKTNIMTESKVMTSVHSL